MCPHFQFNERTLREIEFHRQGYNILPANLNGTSVAFHLRRGDKIKSKLFHPGRPRNLNDVLMYVYHTFVPRGESRMFSADAYVDKLRTVLPKGITVDHCFVSSDDYDAVRELDEALQRHNVQCALHTLTEPKERGNNVNNKFPKAERTVHFLAELQIMIEATYFVGTFNSNVGLFVTAMRGCQLEATTTMATDRTHFARSYAVDRNAFYLQ